jgi:hypothetical protein
MTDKTTKPTADDVIKSIVKKETEKDDLASLIECREVLALGARIEHRGDELASDLELAALLLLKMGHTSFAQEVNETAATARRAAQNIYPPVHWKLARTVRHVAERSMGQPPTN